MDTGKHGNSDASSQESDNQPEKSNEEGSGVGRSYECTFCKRGFTNAQALGGHMNIHRKDKPKAKQKNQEETSNKSNIPRYTSSSQVVSNADHQQQRGCHHGVVGGEMMSNHQVYLPSSNPNFQTGNYLPLWRPNHLNGRAAANLSLRIGISLPAGGGDGEGEDVDSNVKENDVDLELRLGHQP